MLLFLLDKILTTLILNLKSGSHWESQGKEADLQEYHTTVQRLLVILCMLPEVAQITLTRILFLVMT